jgi:hypothetical protein
MKTFPANSFHILNYYITYENIYEFFLSFNTTLCLGLSLLLFVLMRKYSNMIKDETLDDIAIKVLPYIPNKFIDTLPSDEYDVESPPRKEFTSM